MGQERTGELDRVAAVVNHDVVLASEVARRVRHLEFDLRRESARLPTRERLERRAVDELVLESLQLRLADDLGVTIAERELDETIARIARQNRVTVAQLRRSLESGGVPFAEFRARLRGDLRIERVRRREVFNRIRIGDAEVERFMASLGETAPDDAEYLIAHILVDRADGDDVARARAEEVLERLRGGEAFEELARRYSSGGRAAEGGILGWRTAAKVPTLFAGLVPGLDRGETSGILESPSGFHLIRLVDVRHSGRNTVRQTRASHILIATSELVGDRDARARLDELRRRILGGDEFAELARYHSDDTASAIRGGDLGWLSPRRTDPSFEAVMDRLEINEVSEPFRTSAGWHLVRVEGRRDHDDTQEVRRNRARSALFQRRANQALSVWLRQLRDDAFVRILPVE